MTTPAAIIHDDIDKRLADARHNLMAIQRTIANLEALKELQDYPTPEAAIPPTETPTVDFLYVELAGCPCLFSYTPQAESYLIDQRAFAGRWIDGIQLKPEQVHGVLADIASCGLTVLEA